jgi:hypothetical protein
MENSMSHKYTRLIQLGILLLLVISSFAAASVKWKAMVFDNPGTKRLLKTDKGGIYLYRSMPEKSMFINVTGLTVIELRAIGMDKVSKPGFTIKYGNKRVNYDLKLTSVSAQYQVFEPIRLTLPPDTKQLELISYNRNLYYRAFKPETIQKKKVIVPPLKITNKAGEYSLKSPTGEHKYYALKDSVTFAFEVNKGRAFSLYIRAELTGKQVPVVGLYQDGQLVQKIPLSLKRTSTYAATGLKNLTTGKKLDFAPKAKLTKYELRPMTGHLFIVRPVIKKTR